MQHSKFRGYDIEYINNQWVFADTKDSIIKYHDRTCCNCGKSPMPEGYDGCIGRLGGVMNACCGHGNINETYVQFLDGFSIQGEDAKIIIDILKKYN